MNFGYVKFIRPQHPTLRQWIKGYYVQQSNQEDFHTSLTFYQNITTTISVYKDSATTSSGRYRQQRFQAGKGFSALLVGLVDKYQQVEFFGPIDRLGIVFYPLGINHFLRQPLGDLLKRHYSFFDCYEDAFTTFLPAVYAADKLEQKRDLLDDFFLHRFQAPDLPLLFKAVELLTTSDEELKVQVLAAKLGVSRRTLLRRFKKYLGYSVEEYMSVIRFRKALSTYQKTKGQEPMSYIAMESNYYDQADFNHHVKARADLTPKELFEQLRIVDNTLFWKS